MRYGGRKPKCFAEDDDDGLRNTYRGGAVSRGHGHVQRAILAHLAEVPAPDGYPNWTSVQDVAEVVYDTDAPTTAQLVAVRRAVRALAAEGAAESMLDAGTEGFLGPTRCGRGGSLRSVSRRK